MDQLLKVTSIPFQAICFKQNARLLPSDSVTLERHKALARHNALKQQYRPGSTSLDFDYINQVNMAFSEKSSADSGTAAVHASRTAASDLAFKAPAASTVRHSSAPVPAPQNVNYAQHDQQSTVSIPETAGAAAGASSEISSSYTVQRGSFELRVAKGELSYVPPLVMTIVTQYPDVEFEYTGGFNYFPPQEESSEMNLTI